MSDRVKIGIIGVGAIGKGHLGLYQQVPGAQIVAIADIAEAEAQRVAQEHHIPQVFTNYHDLLRLPEIQAVDVCLHNNLHAPVTIDALEAGKHVYCEKPMAGSYVDAQAMVEAAQRCGRQLMIQLGTLFQMETRAAQRLIEGGYLGKPYYAKSVGFRRRGRPYVDGYGTASFVQKKVAAGGALYDMGVYHIAQILYLLGNPAIVTLSGTTHQEIEMYEERRKDGNYDVEELGLGFARLDGGITLFIEESWAMHLDTAGPSVILGSKGGIRLSPFAYFSTVCDLGMDATFDLERTRARWQACLPEGDAYQSQQHYWIAALQGRVPLIDTAGIALATMKISEGIYLSARLGREVTAQEIETNSQSTAVKGL